MNTERSDLDTVTFRLDEMFSLAESAASTPILESGHFSRARTDLPSGATMLRDDFPDAEGACCCFLRLPPGTARVVRFVVEGARELETCASGGWLIEASNHLDPAYWVPRLPTLRSFDEHGRILREEAAAIVEFHATPATLELTVSVPEDLHLDWLFWRLDANAGDLVTELRTPLNVERQRTYLWSSQTIYRSPADVYSYLIHGHVYQNARAWPRGWKFCSELDAYELYLTLSGLELATGKRLYGLLKRQILLSVISRQAHDGAWYQGEWTDLMEWHARFHAGALLLLESALEERHDSVVGESLAKGAAFAASRTDHTDLGLWFLHDSLEESAEAMQEMVSQMVQRTGAGAWKPSRMLGKSATNKMVLNTHVDTTVALDRYREITGDHQYDQHLASAVRATRALLNLRPAEPLYRLVYRAINLTLLPVAQAEHLPLPLRALKRATSKYLLPQVYRVKRAFPRIVMPGGFTERHLSPLHFDPKYHAVNILDLARLWRRFPEPDIWNALRAATGFVTDTSILDYWAEAKPRQFAIVVWADALYHLCMLNDSPGYRRHLADAMLRIEDAGLGYPPSLLGANPEAVEPTRRVGCPSPADARLRVANLCGARGKEIIVVNPSTSELELAWESDFGNDLVWTVGENPAAPPVGTRLRVPARGWLWGKESGRPAEEVPAGHEPFAQSGAKIGPSIA